MFEATFKSTLYGLDNTALVDSLWREIADHYSASGRYYHTLYHLDQISNELAAIKNEIEDWQTVVAAVAYHDIIYDPLHHDNEEKSASLAYDRLKHLGWPSAQINNCTAEIMATKYHHRADNPDTNFLIDADLSILGTEHGRYLEYALQIRMEYKMYPDVIYLAGRKKVLAHFIAMESIFKTAHFRTLYEQQARKNIAMELEALYG